MRQEFIVRKPYTKRKTIVGIMRRTGGNSWFTNWEFSTPRKGIIKEWQYNSDSAFSLVVYELLYTLYGALSDTFEIEDTETGEVMRFEDAVDEDYRLQEEGE